MTLSARDGKLIVGNVDFDTENGAFGESNAPPATRAYLRGHPISEATLSKIRELVNSLDKPTGKIRLNDIGLNDKQASALVVRAQLLLEHQYFANSVAEMAADAKLSPAMIEKLATDTDFQVRAGIAENPSAESRVLALLARDRDPYVRAAVAKNPKMDLAVLNSLVEDPIDYVRSAAAANPSLPVESLNIWAKRGHACQSRGSQKLKSKSRFAWQLVRDRSTVREALASNPAANDQLLSQLVNDKSVNVRKALAANVRATDSLLDQLASDRT